VQAAYDDVRNTFRDGDLLLFRGNGLFSILVRLLTRSPYSHAGLVYTFEGNVYCIEAVGAGVRLIRVSELVRRYHGGIDHFALPEAQDTQRRRAVSFAFRQLGKLYNTLGIVRYTVALLLDRKGYSKRTGEWFCSELVAAAYAHQGYDLVSNDEDAYTSPSDLATSPRVQLVCTIKRVE
jgi:uncharacterized protein YycO